MSYGLSSYGYDIRVADEFKIFTNINNTVIDPKNFDPRSLRRRQGRRLHRPAELVRAGADDRAFPHPARRPDGLPRQVHLRALRDHRERHAVRAGVGGHRHARDLEHARRCPRRSTPTRASRRCCSSRATSRAEVSYADKKGKYLKQRGVTLPADLALMFRLRRKLHALDPVVSAFRRTPTPAESKIWCIVGSRNNLSSGGE